MKYPTLQTISSKTHLACPFFKALEDSGLVLSSYLVIIQPTF